VRTRHYPSPMTTLARRLALALLVICVAGALGCATRKPVLYPNEHVQDVGPQASQADVDACLELADAADLDDSRAEKAATKAGTGAVMGAAVGAAIGAVTGRPGTGAAAGAAGGGTRGFFSGIFGGRDPDPVYKRYVETCLQERGYQPLGWK